MTQTESAGEQFVGCVMLIVIAVIGWYGVGYFFGGSESRPSVRPRPAVTIPRPRPSPDYNRFCRSAFEDLKFLDVMFDVTQRPSYKPTSANCKKMTQVVLKRFPSGWMRKIGTATIQPGERFVATAARRVEIVAVDAVVNFACRGKRGLSISGRSLVPIYQKQYRETVRDLRQACLRELR